VTRISKPKVAGIVGLPDAGAASAAAAGSAAIGYAEDHCALDWPLLTSGIYAPLLAIGLFAAAVAAGITALDWVAIPIAFVTAAWWAAGGAWLPYVWPTGIRLTGSGVRIGGLRWAERHPGRPRPRQAIVPRQYSQVFSCPWSGVLGIGVTTDHEVLRAMKRHAYRGRRLTPLGNLATPFMRAALVIWVDQNQAQLPEIRPARSRAWSSSSAPGFHQPVWVVPTRRSAELIRALPLLPVPPGAVRDPAEMTGEGSPVADWPAS
jgi:hypothetical protein